MESEARFTPPRADCPHPERWSSPDADSTEIEVSRLVGAFVRALRPDFVVETGSAFGQTSEQIGLALHGQHGGSLMTFEVDPERVRDTRERCKELPVDVIQDESLEGIRRLGDAINHGRVPKIGFAWLDSLLELRVPELEAITPLLNPMGAVVGIHDAGEPENTKYNQFAQEVADAARRLGYSRISLPTPRGVTFLSWWG